MRVKKGKGEQIKGNKGKEGEIWERKGKWGCERESPKECGGVAEHVLPPLKVTLPVSSPLSSPSPPIICHFHLSAPLLSAPPLLPPCHSSSNGEVSPKLLFSSLFSLSRNLSFCPSLIFFFSLLFIILYHQFRFTFILLLFFLISNVFLCRFSSFSFPQILNIRGEGRRKGGWHEVREKREEKVEKREHYQGLLRTAIQL